MHTEPKVYTVSAYSTHTHTHIHIRSEKRETFDGRTKASIQYRDNKNNNKVDKE